MVAFPDAGQLRRTSTGTLLVVALAYMVLLGGTGLGEEVVLLRLLNGVLGGALIVAAIFKIGHERLDRSDGLVVAALVLFSVAGAVSAFPRQSFDAVLAGLAFTAAYLIARKELRRVGNRQLLIGALLLLSAVMTFLTFLRWVLPIVEWWAGTGWQVIPSLSFELAGYPWGHRHDLTLLVVLLYPAWWVGDATPLRRVARIVVGALLVPVVLVDGSRAVWLAMAIATMVLAAPALIAWWRESSRGRVAFLVVAAVLVALLVVSGLGSAVVQRGLNPATLGWRTAMWGPLLEQWASQPLAGQGPGSFPWVLQLTDYFDTNSWAPRHPDSAVVQAIAEAGLIGLAALASIIAAVLPAVWRGPSVAARWAVVTFALASLVANPTDFAFLIVLAIAWAAYGAPRATAGIETPRGRRSSLIRLASAACAIVVILAYGLAAAGALAYERARSAVADGNLELADLELDAAVGFDPGMALYPRQRGAAALVAGDVGSAIADLALATRLNPADDLAWRTLALANSSAGDVEGGQTALDQAVQLQRSDSTNLWLSAVSNIRAGREEEASEEIAEIIQAWPTIVFSAGWPDGLPNGVQPADLASEAMDHWLTNAPTPEPAWDQGVWLAAMSGRSNLSGAASDASAHSADLDAALGGSVRCEDVTDLIARMAPEEQRSYLYWWLLARDAIARGDSNDQARKMAELMGHPLNADLADRTMNPLNENEQFGRYGWGYRRTPIDWPVVSIDLPSPIGGLMRWIHEPRAAAASAGLTESLPTCAAIVP